MNEITFDQLPWALSQLITKVDKIDKFLIETKYGQSPEPETPVGIKQASLIVNKTVATLYGYVSRGEIPVCKRGNRLYFSKIDLLAWIKAGQKKTLSETSNEADTYLSNKRRG